MDVCQMGMKTYLHKKDTKLYSKLALFVQIWDIEKAKSRGKFRKDLIHVIIWWDYGKVTRK